MRLLQGFFTFNIFFGFFGFYSTFDFFFTFLFVFLDKFVYFFWLLRLYYFITWCTGMANLGTLTGELLRRYVCRNGRVRPKLNQLQLAKAKKLLIKERQELKENLLNDENQMECAICLEPLLKDEGINELKCNSKHVYHHECMLVWVKTNSICPMCRMEIV